MPSTKPRVMLYMDETTLAKLKDWAVKDRRSVTSLINILIEDAIAEREKKAEQ